MTGLPKILRHTAFAVVLAGLVAVPALARLDVYRCTGMHSTHVGRCCQLRRERASSSSWRAARRACCDLESKGNELPPAAASGAMVVVGAPAALVVAELALDPSVPAIPQRVRVRSRAPPSAPLWLQHQTFLL